MNRRVKIVALPVEAVMGCLDLSDQRFIERISLPSLPAGYKVVGVFGNWPRRCIDVMVSHESFPEVPIGEQLPRLPETPAEIITFARVIRRGDAGEPTTGVNKVLRFDVQGRPVYESETDRKSREKEEAVEYDLPVYREAKL